MDDARVVGELVVRTGPFMTLHEQYERITKERDALQSRLELVQAKLDAVAGLADRWVNDPKYSLDQCVNDIFAALGGESPGNEEVGK